MMKLKNFVMFMYLFLLPWDSYFLLNLGFPISPSFIFIGIILLVFIYDIIYRKNKFKFNSIFFLMFIFFVYIFTTILWTSAPNSFFRFIILLSYFSTSYILYNYFHHEKIKALMISGYYFGILTISLFTLISNNFEISRFSVAQDYNPTWFAAQLLWALLISFFIYCKFSFFGKISIILGNLFLFGILLLTQGRNSLLTLILSLLFSILIIFVLIRKKILKGFVFISIIFLLLYIFIFYIIGEDNLQYLLNTIDSFIIGDASSATAGRNVIWAYFIDIIPDNLILGSGIYSSSYVFIQPPHNVYLLVLHDYGLIGFSLFILFLISLFYFSIKSKKNRFSITVLSLALILLGMGNDTLYYKYWWTGFWLFVIIASIHEREICDFKKISKY